MHGGGSTGLETAADVTCLRGAPTPLALPGHRTTFRAVVAAGCGEWLLREVSRVAQLPRPASEQAPSFNNSPPALRDSHCSRSRPDLDAACRDQRIFDVHPLVFCRPDCGRHRLEFAHAPRFAPHSRYTRRRYASCWVVSLITAPSGYRTPVRPTPPEPRATRSRCATPGGNTPAIVPALTKGPACRVNLTRYRCRTSSRPDRISIQCAATSSRCVSRTAGVGASPRICASNSRCSDSSSRASGSYNSRSPASSA
jgi:hypothetical protein